MLHRALHIHAASEKEKDREWIHVLLHFLRAYVDSMGKDLLLGEEDNKAYIEGLITSLQITAQALDSGNSRLLRATTLVLTISTISDMPFPDHSALSVTLLSQDASLAGDRDGATLKAVVRNKLPCVSTSSAGMFVEP